MILVGLVGESPHDTTAVANLLRKKYPGLVSFVTLTPDIRGGMLEDQPTKHILRKQYQKHSPSIVVFIRDLDSLEGNSSQFDLRKKYYTEFRSIVDKQSVYLLNIYALEALLLADIDAFNQHYNTSVVYSGDPMHLEKPEVFLKEQSQYKYKESHTPELFQKLDFNKLRNVRYFERFINEFETALKSA